MSDAASQILTEDDLLKITQFESRGHLERCLTEQRIPYFRGRGGIIWTTLHLVESAKLSNRPVQSAAASAPTSFDEF